MGDVILTSSVVRCLKEQMNWEIHFLIKESFSSLVSENPHIKKVHFLNKPLEKTISVLTQERFDLIIDLQKNRKSRLISKNLGIHTIRFDKLNVKKWILVQSGINLLPKKHIVDRYFDALAELNVRNDLKGNELFVNDQATISVATLELPKTYITLAVGAQHQGKSMSLDQLQQVAECTALPIVLLGGSSESNLADQIVKGSRRTKTLINLVNKTSILELIEVIKHSRLLISGDTGAMHIASAFKIPQIAVWGCTTPDLGMWPYLAHEDSINLEPQGHSHRPCSKLGNRCKYAPQWCIHSIPPSEICSAVTSILTKKGL